MDWAGSGVVALTGRPEGPPRVPPGRAASVAADLAARFASATGVLVDGAALLGERAALTGHTRRGSISAGGACRLLRTADGWAAVSCARPDDPVLLGALVEAELGADPWPRLADELRTLTAAELAERAAMLGVAASPVGAPAPESPSSPTHRVNQAPLAVRDALVVDFSALWAGPLCAHLLGLAGAHVVKVETTTRPDGARRGDRAFYRLLHAGHRSVAIDPENPRDRAAVAAFVDAADVVVEASRPRALRGFGIDAHASAARGTRWVSITAWGRGDERVGFGDDVAAGAGLVTHDDDGIPLFCGDAIADPLSGLQAAVTVVESAPGVLDVPMAAVVASTLDGTRGGPARRCRGGWTVDTPAGPVPVVPPRARTVAGRADAPTHGQDTAADVLEELG